MFAKEYFLLVCCGREVCWYFICNKGGVNRDVKQRKELRYSVCGREGLRLECTVRSVFVVCSAWSDIAAAGVCVCRGCGEA